MSDDNHAAGLIARLPATVALPSDFFGKSGAVATKWDDLRRFPRFYLRSAAALEPLPGLPALRRPDVAQRVYVKDISRVAIAILHGEQWFPGERLRLTLHDGVRRGGVVVRCRRIGVNCYEVAARFDA